MTPAAESPREGASSAPPADDPRDPAKVAQRPTEGQESASAPPAVALADALAHVAAEMSKLGRAWQDAARAAAPGLTAALERLAAARVELPPELFTHPRPDRRPE
jgi:hypothetical protein